MADDNIEVRNSIDAHHFVWGDEPLTDMIEKAIKSKPNSIAKLKEIYQYMIDNYAYFRVRKDGLISKGWKIAVRNTILLHRTKFIKVESDQNGENSLWTLTDLMMESVKKSKLEQINDERSDKTMQQQSLKNTTAAAVNLKAACQVAKIRNVNSKRKRKSKLNTRF